MKKIFRLVSLIIFTGIGLSLSAQQNIAVANLSNIGGVVTKQDFKVKTQALSPVAQQAIRKGEKPGEFRNVRYAYTNKVRVLSPAQSGSVYAGIKANGIVNTNALKQFKPTPGLIYIDPKKSVAMQFAPVGDKEMIAMKPQLNEIFKDINIPDQEVKLTLANTSFTAEKTNVTSFGVGPEYTMVMHFDSVAYKLKEGDVNMQIALVGDIKFKFPRIEGKYSNNDGYKLVFKTEEVADLKLYSTAKISKEFKKPVWGFNIKAGDIGEATLAVLLVIDMNGEVKLEVHVDQGLKLEAGARGGTFAGSPTSVHSIVKINPWCNVDYNITSKATIFAGLLCQTKLKIYNVDAFDIYAKSGGEITVETNNLFLDADAGFRIKVGGKLIRKKFTLYNKYISLWQLHQRDFGGYEMNILEADAYRDYVIGNIQNAAEKMPYSGDLTVYVKHPDGRKDSYQGKTVDDGYFAIQNIPLKKGDKLSVKVPGSPNESGAVDCSIPFKKVNLFYADYFSGQAKGIVGAKLSKYEYLLKPENSKHIPSGVITGGMYGNKSFNKVKAESPGVSIQKKLDEFRKNMLVYNGPIKIVVEDDAHGNNASGNTSSSVNIPRIGISATGSHNVKKHTHTNTPQHIVAQGRVNAPLGMFTVTNLNLKPFQKVKARINIDGFIVESEAIETDGLLVSGIITDNLTSKMTATTKTVRADNAMVVVSALRSSRTPTGSLKMIMGTDMKHSSVANPAPKLHEIPEAIKPFIFFNKTVPLKPAPGNPGVSIAETGSWNSTLTFRSGADLFSPWKSSGHHFEYVSYKYKGVELGYKYYQEKCPACTSPENFSKDLMNTFGSTGSGHGSYNTPQKVNIKPKVPGKQPKMNNTKINMNKGVMIH